MIRMVTQLLLGLMLFFGMATIFPKAIYYLRVKNIRKGVLYLFLCSLCALFSVLAFHYAYMVYKEFNP